MTDSMMSKAATMEIPINSNGDTGTLPEDDSLEQVGHICCVSWQSVVSSVYTPRNCHNKSGKIYLAVIPSWQQIVYMLKTKLQQTEKCRALFGSLIPPLI